MESRHGHRLQKQKSTFDTSNAPTTDEDFISMCEEFDFLHMIISDLHGHPRVSVFPAEDAEHLVTNGYDFEVTSLAYSIDGEMTSIPDQTNASMSNIIIRPIIETARACPWLGKQTNSRIMEVMATPEWLSGEKIEADPRRIALNQIQRLSDRGLEMFSGTECEFRLFEQQNSPNGEPIPAHCNLNMNNTHIVHQYERFYVELHKRIRAVGFKLKTFRNMNECGKLKVPLTPDWGIKSADDLFRFKMIVRDIARECGYKASFMTKVLPNGIGNGFHMNHSIWKSVNGKLENFFFDGYDVDKLSSFGKHWLAGLLHHANAISALTSPTVNCYRRIHKTWGPKYADWGVENGLTSFSAKLRGPNELVILENKCPSSATNPYLVLACTIAAGLDGVDRKLDLVLDGSKEMGTLPHDLTEACQALKNDEIMISALGEQFVDWFFAVKISEIGKLQSTDVSIDRKIDYEKERQVYFSAV